MRWNDLVLISLDKIIVQENPLFTLVALLVSLPGDPAHFCLVTIRNSLSLEVVGFPFPGRI